MFLGNDFDNVGIESKSFSSCLPKEYIVLTETMSQPTNVYL